MAEVAVIPSHQIRAKAREVVSHHCDTERLGKPLYLLIPGGVFSAGALVAILLIGYAAFVNGTMPTQDATKFIALLLLPYFGSLLMFSYGYELYDWPKAIRLTLIVGFIGLAAILVIVAIGFALTCLSESKGGGSSSSSKSSSSSNSKSSSISSTGQSILAGAAHTTPHFSGLTSSTPSLNIGGFSAASGGPTLDSVARCPICGIPLPGGAGSTCPNCALQQARLSGQNA